MSAKTDFAVKSRKKAPWTTKNPIMMNEAPEVIEKMSTVIGNGGSLDTAIRDLASGGPPIARAMFSSIVADADTRIRPDMAAGLSAAISSFHESAAPYGMALRLVVSASDSRDRGERSRMLREASELALSGLRDSGKAFSASLNTPCMTIFGLGIMIPMVMMSIMPMMGMSGLFGTSFIDPMVLSLITLVLIPAVVLSVILTVAERNPLRERVRDRNLLPALPLVSAVPGMLLLLSRGTDACPAFCIAMIAAGLLTTLCMYKPRRGRYSGRKVLKGLQESVFEIGNRLVAGSPFENALHDALSSRPECATLGSAFRNEVIVRRGNVAKAIEHVFAPVSKEIEENYRCILSASEKDLHDAGNLAVSLGRQIKDRNTIRNTIRNELKSMTDTMSGTAAVFAPLVLGLSVAMLAPMQDVMGTATDGSTNLVLAVYLTELSALVSLLLSFLGGRSSPRDVVRRFSLLLPVSLCVFLTALNLSF